MSGTLDTAILCNYWSSDLEELHLWGSKGKVFLSLRTEAESASETSRFLIRWWRKSRKIRLYQWATHHCRKQIVSVSHTPLSKADCISEPHTTVESRLYQWATHHCRSPIVLYGSLHIFPHIFVFTSYRLDYRMNLANSSDWPHSRPKVTENICQNEEGNSAGPHYKCPNNLTRCGRVTQICDFNTVKLGTSASSP